MEKGEGKVTDELEKWRDERKGGEKEDKVKLKIAKEYERKMRTEEKKRDVRD